MKGSTMIDKIPATPKKPRVNYGDDNESTRLSIQCIAESHADRPWLVDSFVLEEGDENAPRSWAGSTTYWRDGKSVAKLKIGASRTSLVENRPVSAEEFKRDPFVFDNGSRSRYNFKCEICGLSVVRQSEAVMLCFDRLAEAGVSEISLSVLAAILK